MIEAILITLLSVPVLIRAGCVLAKVGRSRFRCRGRFQFFLIAYALLGAVTSAAVRDAWQGQDSALALGFVAASALLILIDPRRNHEPH